MSLYAIRYNKAGQLVYSTDHAKTKDALIVLEVPHTDNALAKALHIPRPTAYNIFGDILLIVLIIVLTVNSIINYK